MQLIVFLGDLSDLGDEATLDQVLAPAPGPLAAVAGNHDGDRAALERVATRHTTVLLDRHAVPVDSMMILGIGAEATETGRPRYRSVRPAIPDVVNLLIVASHFPLLSEASRLATAGLPHPGDLVDRDVLARRVVEVHPALVNSGHVHARLPPARPGSRVRAGIRSRRGGVGMDRNKVAGDLTEVAPRAPQRWRSTAAVRWLFRGSAH